MECGITPRRVAHLCSHEESGKIWWGVGNSSAVREPSGYGPKWLTGQLSPLCCCVLVDLNWVSLTPLPGTAPFWNRPFLEPVSGPSPTPAAPVSRMSEKGVTCQSHSSADTREVRLAGHVAHVFRGPLAARGRSAVLAWPWLPLPHSLLLSGGVATLTGGSHGGAALVLSREPSSYLALTFFPLKSCVLRSFGPFRLSEYCLLTLRLFHDYNLSISCALSFFMGRWRLNGALKSKGDNTPRKRPPESTHYIVHAQVTCQTSG